MFDLKQRNYRKFVKTNMIYFVGFDENYVKKLSDNFVNLKKVCKNESRNGNSELICALRYATILFTNIIENTYRNSEDSKNAIEFLQGKNVKPRFDVEPMIKTFLSQVTIQKDIGGIDEISERFAFGEILGALQGLTREERSKKRILAALDGHLPISAS
jgi:hypothetical protein